MSVLKDLLNGADGNADANDKLWCYQWLTERARVNGVVHHLNAPCARPP
jgi:hypothetical protein